MWKRLLLISCIILAAACSGSENKKSVDAAPSVDAFSSKCGHPGDTGNELGIGKFCTSISDCSDTQSAPLCSSLGDPDTHFCTRTCQMGSASACGTGAECTCNANNQCGCTPSACL